EVIACDIDPDALLASAANARLNGVDYRLHGDLFAFDEPLDLLIAADVLYDRANLPLLEVFRAKATEVLVADSRIKDFDFPPYQALGQHESFTVPDLDELDEFRWVPLYRAAASPACVSGCQRTDLQCWPRPLKTCGDGFLTGLLQ